MNDGGPAFPTPSINVFLGMSLRDYFAGQAIQGMCSGQVWPRLHDGQAMALRAYAFADAMLAERAKSQQE